MKVLFVINGLEKGGAEQMLVRLVSNHAFQKDEVTVVSLMGEGVLTKDLQSSGHKIIHLNATKSLFGIARLSALRQILLDCDPQLVHSWLYQSDLAATFFNWCATGAPIIWSIRQSNLSFDHNKVSTLLCVKICALLSRYAPAVVLSNSKAGQESHIKAGYARRAIRYMGNGISLKEFRVSRSLGRRIRIDLNIPQDAPVVGMVARFDTQKNHKGFFAAAKLILCVNPDVHFLLVGKNITSSNDSLMRLARESGVQGQCHFLGQRADMPSIFNCLSLLLSPSVGEGWPNVIAEAMACGIPCVATDVGETSELIGGLGRLAANGDMVALAQEALRILSLSSTDQAELSSKVRARAEACFDIDVVTNAYRTLYSEVISSVKGPF